ncbi:MAG: CPBP family glutamic-type intramembrane protease [bacterium]|nr:CPBP family glutamic-type intramembrane protease [bacterium]
MKNLTLKQIILPIVTLSFILFMYFGPVTRTIFENIIISLVIIVANFIEFKGKAFSSLGFYRERFNAKNLLLIAPLTAFGLFVFYVFALVPTVEMLTGDAINYTNTEQLRGNLPTTLTWLLVIWVTAAFGEEIIFRGFFVRQFVKFFGDSKISLLINMLIFCSFFGYMHMQQGLTGQIVATTVGALFFIIFYLRKYDLWFMIMIHGFFNTLGILSFYFGLA